MKVVHIFHELKFSGAEKMYVEAAPIFQEKGCELIAIATGENIGDFAPHFLEAGYRVIHFPLPDIHKTPFVFILYYVKFYHFLKTERADVLHIHKNGKFWWFAFCSRLAKIRTVRTIHNIFVNSKKVYWIKYWFERWTARNLFGVTFQSIGDSVQKNELRYFNKTIKVYNWYGINFFPANNDEKKANRGKLNIDIDQFVILSIGGCSKVKNHHEIVRCLSVLHHELNFLYVHLGTGTTENEEKNLAEKLGLLEKIRFEGNKSNVRDYLIASDVFVMPSQFEGLSIASIEAQACGIPTIVYNNPGVRDIIENGYNGFLISPDYQLIAEKILCLYRDKEKANEIGRNAIQYSRENFSMGKNALKIFDLYSK